MKVYKSLYQKIISTESLFLAWDEFRRGKASRSDVGQFEWNLEENIFKLHDKLASDKYKHGPYYAFYITDPKQRLIHKASVKDRIVHHAIFKVLNPVFEPTFIADSFSCRVDKGTHRGVRKLAIILRQVSSNNNLPCWALKCDIYKFFASIDHEILLKILNQRIDDKKLQNLLRAITNSFDSGQSGKGLPIGNLTSQLFANIYMNELDQFVKHKLRVKNYVRYTDDFVIVSQDKKYLMELLPKIEKFLAQDLKLKLHPSKIIIKKYSNGVDFLGYVILPHYIKLRTKTKRRMLARVNERNLPSYLGVLSHASSYRVEQEVLTKLRLDSEVLK